MGNESTRWTVIKRAASGHPADRTEIVRRYRPVIRAYLGARWRGTPLSSEVDDAAQQVFLECFKANGALSRADPTRAGGFRGYLFGITRNVARMAERARARAVGERGPSGIDLAALAANEDSVAQVFDRAWAQGLLRDAAALQLQRARDKGPEAVRRHELLMLRFGEDLPIREIAARWDADPAVLHREYPKAREEFRRALMDVVRELHGGGTEAIEEECARLRLFSF